MATIDGQPCTALVFTEPRRGRWWAHFSVQPDKPPATKCNLTVEGESTPRRQSAGVIHTPYSEEFGVFVGVMRGGKGDVSKMATPKHYRIATIRSVVTDLLGDAGESLSAEADPSVLGTSVENYSTLTLPIGAQLTRVLATTATGAVWRFKPDGTVWVGVDRWEQFSEDLDLMQREPIRNAIEVSYPDASHLVGPGVTVDNRRVSLAEHRLTADGLRSTLFLEDPT